MDPQVALARAIKLRREELKLSQEALAGRCGVDNTAISHLESGRVDPKFGTVWRIADGLGMPASFLVASAEDLLPSSGSKGPSGG